MDRGDTLDRVNPAMRALRRRRNDGGSRRGGCSAGCGLGETNAMNLRRLGLLLSVSAVSISQIGCEDLRARQDPLTGQAINAEANRRYYRPMVMNATMHDMSVADIHFVPHTSELSELGVVRLADLALVLDRFGGTVRYETFEKDRDRNSARLASVERHLTELGIDMTNVNVANQISGGRGMLATDAIAAKMKAARITGGATKKGATRNK